MAGLGRSHGDFRGRAFRYLRERQQRIGGSMGKAGEKATMSGRRSRSRETFSVFAVIAAVAAVTFGLSSAQAHTTTATLLPDGQGFYTDWANGESAIDE